MSSDVMNKQKIEQLQLLEQGLHSLSSQRQELESKQLETDSALQELQSSATSYKLIGNVMIKVSSDSLVAELQKSKETAMIRIKSIEKQEAAMREKAKALQQEVMKGMGM